MASNPPSGIRPPGPGVSKSRMPPPGSSGLALPRPSGLPAPTKKNLQGQRNDQSQRSSSTASSADRGDCLTTDTDSFIIGETVWVGGTKRGKITFIGETQFAKGEWAGIVLDEPIGKNDGTISGVRYFQCEPLHGTFTRLSRLSRTPLIPIDPSKECEVHGSTPPRCLVERQRSTSPFTSKSPSPGHITPSRLGSPAPVKVGERVIVQSATGTKRGTLQFLGSTEFAAGEWAGIELDQPIGKNDGAVGGVRYFQCKNNYGLFAPIHKISSSPSNRRPSTNLRRFGSKESMTSNISSVASSMAVRSVRAVLMEKEKHVEQLIQEKDLDRNELAEKITQLKLRSEDLSRLQGELQTAQEKLSTHDQLMTELENLRTDNQTLTLKSEESARKLEDIQFAYEEENIIKSELIGKLEALQKDQHVLNDDELVRIQTELESRNAAFARLEEELSKLRAEEALKKVEMLEKTLSSGDAQPIVIQDDSKLLEKISEQETKLKAYEAEKVKLEDERKALSERLTLSETKAEQLTEKMQNLESELKEQNLQIQTLRKLETEQQQATDALTLKEANVVELNAQLQKFEEEKKKREMEIKDLKKLEEVHKKLTGTLNEKETKIMELGVELQKFEEEKQKREQEINELKKLESDLTKLTETCSTKESKIVELDVELQKFKDEKKKKDLEITELKKVEAEHMKLTQTLNEKELKVTSLEEAVSKLEEEKIKRYLELQQLQTRATESETRLEEEHQRTIQEIQKNLDDSQKNLELKLTLIENLQKELETKDKETKILQDKISSDLSDRMVLAEDRTREMQLSTLEIEQDCRNKIKEFNTTIQNLQKKLEESYSKSELNTKVEAVQNEFSKKIEDLKIQLASSAGLLAEKETSLESAKKDLQTKDKLVAESKLKLDEILSSEQKLKTDFAECKAVHETTLQLLTSTKDNLTKEHEALLLTSRKKKQELADLQKVHEETVELLKTTKASLSQEKEALLISSGKAEEKLKAEMAELKTKYEASIQTLNKTKEDWTNEKDALVLTTTKTEEEFKSDLADLQIKYETSVETLKTTKEEFLQEKEALVLATSKTEEKLKSDLAELQKSHDVNIERLKSINASLLKEKEALVSTSDSKAEHQNEVIRGLETKVAELVKVAKANDDASSSSVMISEKVISDLKLELKSREKTLEDLKKEFSEFQQAKEEQERKIGSEASRKEDEMLKSIAKSKREVEDRNKAITELEKELAQVKTRLTETESSLKLKQQIIPPPTAESSAGAKDDYTEKLKAELSTAEQNVQFLNSIIVDLQMKNTELKQRVEILLTGGDYSDANENTGKGVSSGQVCRLYCDICGEFDIHDTEDCPTQSNQDSSNSKHCAPRGTTRPYCETCEVFGHATGSCNDEETF